MCLILLGLVEHLYRDDKTLHHFGKDDVICSKFLTHCGSSKKYYGCIYKFSVAMVDEATDHNLWLKIVKDKMAKEQFTPF